MDIKPIAVTPALYFYFHAINNKIAAVLVSEVGPTLEVSQNK